MKSLKKHGRNLVKADMLFNGNQQNSTNFNRKLQKLVKYRDGFSQINGRQSSEERSSNEDIEEILTPTSNFSEIDDSSEDESDKGLQPISEEVSPRKSDEDNDESTCCDEDFTWLGSDNSKDKFSTAPIGKPPLRPQATNVERRRQLHNNRRDRDHKSKSSNSLRDNYYNIENKDFHIKSKHDISYQNEFWSHNCRKEQPFCYPSHFCSVHHSNRDLTHHWTCPTSREDLRSCDCWRCQENFRYGSIGALPLGSAHDGYNNRICCNTIRPPSCSYEHLIPFWIQNQRQDNDERIRKLEGDKQTLSHQVQTLTDQVSAQNDKIIELERSLTDKTQLLNNTEDMLQRVSAFAKSVGLRLDQQKEMLSKSSLETQKLELLSAMSELKLQQAALERENFELRASHINNNLIVNKKPVIIPRQATANPQSQINAIVYGSMGNLQQSANSTPKTPPASYRNQVNSHFHSLPRSAFTSPIDKNKKDISLTEIEVSSKNRNVAFAEKDSIISDSSDINRSYSSHPATSPSLSQKSKGFRGIFGKMKRSNSGNLEDLQSEGEFKRGGVRATAGPRLGWNYSQRINKSFKEWNIDDICLWFHDMGLGIYEDDARKWLTNGINDLIKVSPVDIEKELNLKSPLHRKKIILEIAELSGKEKDDIMLKASKLDTLWVMRWLDDIGLPQHKEAFSFARIDGKMLHKLTMDDLNSLHITSCLHVASFRRGIQVMRENNWEADCLIRRSNIETNEKEKVALWTAYRVMEWLRVVDLAEYAPNLRGAGVHGALMIYEPRFTAELLADLLSIPPSKTLLRRHLATHFKELLGRDVIQGKREIENTLGYQPLTITSKIKTPKRTQFSLKRKKSSKSGEEWSDFVCPMGSSGDRLTITSSNQNASVISMMKPNKLETGIKTVDAFPPNNLESPTSLKSSSSNS